MPLFKRPTTTQERGKEPALDNPGELKNKPITIPAWPDVNIEEPPTPSRSAVRDAQRRLKGKPEAQKALLAKALEDPYMQGRYNELVTNFVERVAQKSTIVRDAIADALRAGVIGTGVALAAIPILDRQTLPQGEQVIETGPKAAGLVTTGALVDYIVALSLARRRRQRLDPDAPRNHAGDAILNEFLASAEGQQAIGELLGHRVQPPARSR